MSSHGVVLGCFRLVPEVGFGQSATPIDYVDFKHGPAIQSMSYADMASILQANLY